VVKLLLEKGPDVESKNRYDQMSLLLAVDNRHEAVVRLLLANDRVGPDFKDNNGQTPL
jgi:ankyrin repeat protein